MFRHNRYKVGLLKSVNVVSARNSTANTLRIITSHPDWKPLEQKKGDYTQRRTLDIEHKL